jgi:predicted acyl esterase
MAVDRVVVEKHVIVLMCDASGLMAAIGDPHATLRHRPLLELPGLSRPAVAQWWAEWLEHDRRDSFWEDLRLSRDYADFEVPILHVGGCCDLFSLGSVRNFAGLEAAGKAPQRLWMGAWSRTSYERYHGDVDFGGTGPALFSRLPEGRAIRPRAGAFARLRPR